MPFKAWNALLKSVKSNQQISSSFTSYPPAFVRNRVPIGSSIGNTWRDCVFSLLETFLHLLATIQLMSLQQEGDSWAGLSPELKERLSNQAQGHAHHSQDSKKAHDHHKSVPDSKVHTFKSASSRQRMVPLIPLSLLFWVLPLQENV